MKFSREFVITAAAVLIIGGAAAAGSWILRQRVVSEVDSGLYIAPEVALTQEIRWLQQYVRIDTSNPPGNEIAGARFLQDILRSRGIESEVIESAPGRASLYSRIRGRRSGDALMLLHHIDVAPATPEGWRHEPFSGDIAQGYLWGRGALDMKGIGITHLAAFLDVASQPVPPARDLVFLAVADEETGARLGMEWLLNHRPDLFEGVTECINEGGVTEMIAGEVVYFGIETGSMAQYNFRIEAKDPSILPQVRIALEPLMDPVEPDLVEPAVAEYFSSVARAREVGVSKPYLEDIHATIAAGAYYRLPQNYRRLMEIRAYPRKVSAAGADLLEVVVTAPPAVDSAVVEERVRDALAGLPVVVSRTPGVPPAPFSPTDSRLFHLIGAAARETFGPNVIYGPLVITLAATDSRFLRAAGIDCYGFWPYEVDFFLSQTVHGRGERVRLDYFLSGVELMRRLVTRAVAV